MTGAAPGGGEGGRLCCWPGCQKLRLSLGRWRWRRRRRRKQNNKQAEREFPVFPFFPAFFLPPLLAVEEGAKGHEGVGAWGLGGVGVLSQAHQAPRGWLTNGLAGSRSRLRCMRRCSASLSLCIFLCASFLCTHTQAGTLCFSMQPAPLPLQSPPPPIFACRPKTKFFTSFWQRLMNFDDVYAQKEHFFHSFAVCYSPLPHPPPFSARCRAAVACSTLALATGGILEITLIPCTRGQNEWCL